MPVAKRKTPDVQSVARVAALLDAFDVVALPVSELARRSGLHPSTASRLLATLDRAGLVARVEGGRYVLGLHLLRLAGRVPAREVLGAFAQPAWRRACGLSSWAT